MKQRKLINTVFFFSLLAITACEKTYFARDITENDVALAKMELPVVVTKEVSNITQDAAQSGGDIRTDGGGRIRASGICWSSSPGATVDGFKVANGPTIGEYSSFLSKLTMNTTYYVRAYATNAKGTGYGEEFSFTTTAPVATVQTNEAAAEVTMNSITIGGEITTYGETVTSRGVCWSATGRPTIDDDKTADGSGGGSFTSMITGLRPGVTYRIRAYAINSGGVSYGGSVYVQTRPEVFFDIDGNEYHAVVIGTQTWMKENFKAKRFRNGDAIPNLAAHGADYIATYGQLYNGHAVVDARGLAPEGWRVATLQDWNTLREHVGDDGAKLKEAGTEHWASPNLATNESGFTALPGGLGFGGPDPGEIGLVGFWWTSSSAGGEDLWRFAMINEGPNIIQISNDKSLNFSVRLIKE